MTKKNNISFDNHLECNNSENTNPLIRKKLSNIPIPSLPEKQNKRPYFRNTFLREKYLEKKEKSGDKKEKKIH